MGMNKYRNVITTVDNIRFASKKEADYYRDLKIRKRAGDILDFTLQPRYVLLEPYVNSKGRKIKGVEYVADFLITHKDGSQSVVDCKGVQTKEYKLKKKFFEKNYPFCITEV